MQMPAGTLFTTYKPHVFGDLQVFGGKESFINDFLERPFIDVLANDSGEAIDLLDDAIENGTSVKLDHDCWGRDGMFDDDKQLYAVFEREDLHGFMQTIKKALTVA